MITWLASFPRSGNTFLRIIINKLFGYKTYSIYNDPLDMATNQKLSDIAGHSILEKGQIEAMRSDESYYFIKTHDLPDDHMTEDRVIYIIRDGRESSLSLSRYSHNFEHVGLSFYDIVNGKHQFGNWGEHVNAWINFNHENMLVLKFEDLVTQTSKEVKKIADFLNLDNTDGNLPAISHLKTIDPKFFPSGKTDSWKIDITDREHMYFWFKNFQQMIENGYTQDMPGIFNDIEFQDFLKKINIVNQRLIEKNDQLESEKDNLTRKVLETTKERDRLKNKESELTSKNDILKTAKTNLEQKISSQQSLISDLKKQEAILKKERGDLLKSHEKHIKRQSQLQSELFTHLRDKKTLQEQFERLNTEYNHMASEKEKILSELTNKLNQFNILKSTLENERFNSRHNPVKNFIESLIKPFSIKVMQDLRKAEVRKDQLESAQVIDEAQELDSFFEGDVIARTPSQKPDDHIAAQLEQTEENSIGSELIPPFITLDGLNKILDEINLKAGRNEVYFMTCFDTELYTLKYPLKKPWVGFIHTPQGPIPKWWGKAAKSIFQPNESLFQSKAWDQSKNTCKGLITFSKDHAEKLNNLTEINTKSVLFPLPVSDIKWSPQAFKVNTKTKIIQWGWWLRRIHAIHMLWKSPLQRVFIKNSDETAQSIFDAERDELIKQNLFFDFMEKGLTTVNDICPDDRFEILQGNIAFAYYYATSAPGAVLECIATHTPILVNPLPTIIEYLGENYPFYYYSYDDAIEKAQNPELVLESYEYLRNHSGKSEFNPDYFKQEIKTFYSSGAEA